MDLFLFQNFEFWCRLIFLIKIAVASIRMNLFLYKAGETLELIWRTHFSVQMAQNNVFTADLNGDGVKEIYAGGKDGIVEKYILTETGFVASGTTEDLSYGNYITGDFNLDGLDDFIFIDKNTGKSSLYIAIKWKSTACQYYIDMLYFFWKITYNFDIVNKW